MTNEQVTAELRRVLRKYELTRDDAASNAPSTVPDHDRTIAALRASIDRFPSLSARNS